MTQAHDIYQDFLDKASVALWNRDYTTVAAMLSYPHLIRLPETDRIIQNAAEQQLDAQAFRESLKGLGATAYHRLCRDAQFDPDGPGRITGAHTTYVMRGGSYLTDPYECRMSLMRQPDGRWLADAINVSVRKSGMAYYHPDNIRARTGRPK